MMNQAMQQHSHLSGGDQQVIAMVPRVNIHAFCEEQQTAQMVQSAAADRRMSRAHTSIQLGGVSSAIQIFRHQPTPNVLLVESRSSRDVILAELAQLAEVCSPTTKVIVIGHVNDVILYRELMRQGISEYMVAPLHQLQIIETIANLFADPKSEPVGRIIAFVGARGGVGSSTIAHNTAWLTSKVYSIDTVITDLDLAFGTAGLNFNQEASQGIADALSQPDRVDSTLIDRLLTKCGEKLSLLASPGTVDREFPVEEHSIETILNVVRKSVPCVIVDVPNMWAPWIKYSLVHADDVIITSTPDLAGLRNGKNLVDMLKQARPNDKPPKIILNQVGVPKRPEIPPGEFAKAIEVEPSAVIPYDPQTFGTAASNGQMIVEIAAKTKSAEAIVNLAKSLMGQDSSKKTAKFSLAPLLGKLPNLRKK